MKCAACQHSNPPQALFCGQCGAALPMGGHEPVASASASADSLEYVGFWARVAAAMIDLFAVTVLSLVLYVIATAATIAGTPLGIAGVVVAALGFLLPWLYYWLFTSARGQTPGKMALGIRVVSEHGSQPSLGRSALRELVGKTISSIIPLGFFWAAWDKRKQGWHDKLAGTYVVRAKVGMNVATVSSVQQSQP